MLRFFCCVLVLLTIAYPQEKPNIAVLELSGTGVEKSDLEALSNRLRAELFETNKFTVVERGQMEVILKEQGFQQSGCTDASCAVEVGQLLNVQDIILGSIDRVGRVYSINIRIVSVKDGKIVRNIKNDCMDCTIEELMLNRIRKAARELAGLETNEEQRVDLNSHGRKVIKYRNYKSGESGSLSVSVKPADAEIFIDDSAYGKGNMVVDLLPLGDYRIAAARDSFKTKNKKVRIQYNKTSDVEFSLPRKPVFIFTGGMGQMFQTVRLNNTFMFQAADYSDTLYNSQDYAISNPWFFFLKFNPPPFSQRFALEWFCGTSLGPFRTKSTAFDAQDGVNRFSYSVDHGLIGILLSFAYPVSLINDILYIEPGLCGGFIWEYLEVRAESANAGTYLTNNTVGSYRFHLNDYFYGAPDLGLRAGYKHVFLNVSYRLLLGKEEVSYETDSKFKMVSSVKYGLTVKF